MHSKGSMRPYRTTISRALRRGDDSFIARPLDGDDIALIEQIRTTGRLGCDSLSQVVAYDHWYTKGQGPCYVDENARVDAVWLSVIIRTMPSPPEFDTPTQGGSTWKEYKKRLVVASRKFNREFGAWEREATRKMRERGPQYATVIAELRAQLAEIEASNRATALERIALEKKREAERSELYQQRRVARAKRELQQKIDRKITARTLRMQFLAWNNQQSKIKERQRFIAAQRARDAAEFDASEHNERLAPAAAERQAAAVERQALDAAEQAITSTLRTLRKTERRISNYEHQHDHQGHGGHSREDAKDLEARG